MGDTETAGATSDATATESGASASEASAAAATAASSSGDHGSQDYLGKIRAGGDFAAGEVTKHQSRADKLEAELGRMSVVKQAVERGVPAGDLVGGYNGYMALRNDPRFKKFCEHLETTGELPKGSAQFDDTSGDDDYQTPEEVRLARLESASRESTVSQAQFAMSSHLTKFYEKYDLPTDVRERVQKQLDNQIDTWGRSDQGLQAIRALVRPTGFQSVRTTLLGFLDENEIGQGLERAASGKRTRVRQMATDGPSNVGTSGAEIPADVRSGIKGARAALRFAKEHPELLSG